MEKKEEFLIEIRDALARGYCTKENEKKVLDFDLIYAMGNEIEVLISQELDKAREEGKKEVINELNDLDDVENNDEFGQYKVWAKYLIEQLSKLKTKEDGK